jgi:uncharacterized membrane protein (DUF373 family)
MFLIMVVLGFSMVELCWLLMSSLTNPHPLLLENHELTNVLGVFLLILIGVEFLGTIKTYFSDMPSTSSL